MGYRHQVISDTRVPQYSQLPEWFIEKYEEVIDFDREFWVSYGEHKRYTILENFEADVQKMMVEIDERYNIRLVFFADESTSEFPDVSHVTVTQNEIIEMKASAWSEL